MNCWFCDGEMCWDADFGADEVGTGDENQVAAELHCMNCGRPLHLQARLPMI